MSENSRLWDGQTDTRSPEQPDSLRLDDEDPGTQTKEEPIERRIAPRSIALEYRAWIGWREHGNFVTVAARLLDISRAGVAVVAEDCPPEQRDIWFCLQTGDESEMLTGEVVSIGTGIRGRHLIRIAFWAPCPERLYKAAIHGPLPRSADPNNQAK